MHCDLRIVVLASSALDTLLAGLHLDMPDTAAVLAKTGTISASDIAQECTYISASTLWWSRNRRSSWVGWLASSWIWLGSSEL